MDWIPHPNKSIVYKNGDRSIGEIKPEHKTYFGQLKNFSSSVIHSMFSHISTAGPRNRQIDTAHHRTRTEKCDSDRRNAFSESRIAPAAFQLQLSLRH